MRTTLLHSCLLVLASGAGWLSLAPISGAQIVLTDAPGLDPGGSNFAPPLPDLQALSISSPLTFSFTLGAELLALQTSDPALAANVISGFNEAADLWRAAFVDPITINLTINFKSLGMTILGSTSLVTDSASYLNSRLALLGDVSSLDDLAATANLPNTPSRTFFTNDRAGATILDNDGSANNTVLDVSRANLKAIGLLAGNDAGSDGSVTFSSDFAFDFNRGDGIAGGQFDFVGVAAHEIGHLMGFVSGVDGVDSFTGAGPNAGVDLNGPTAGIGTLDPFRVFSILDLYRYSAQSVSQGPGVLDLATGDTPFFSVDGGATNLGTFSTGVFNGDGRQASHWKDNLTLGIMDPTLAPGELAVIRPLDLKAMDVIGYTPAPVPEPGSAMLLVLGAAVFLIRRRTTA